MDVSEKKYVEKLFLTEDEVLIG